MSKEVFLNIVRIYAASNLEPTHLEVVKGFDPELWELIVKTRKEVRDYCLNKLEVMR